MIVVVSAAWSCPAGHTSTTSVTAVASLHPRPSLTAQLRVHPTRCRSCPAPLPARPDVTVPDEVRTQLTEWARRSGVPCDEWAVAS